MASQNIETRENAEDSYCYPIFKRNGDRLSNLSYFKENIAKSKSYRQLLLSVSREVVLVLFSSLNKIETLGCGRR